jgi:phenylalanyl-tRNA synthetase beta chain
MQISLNWLRDFVEIPPDLDAHALAERLTLITANVEGVQEVRIAAEGLLAAKVLRTELLDAARHLYHVVLDLGARQVETVTIAPNLKEGCVVVYAPVGAAVGSLGKIGQATVAGRTSTGMILPGDALGIVQTTQQAVLLPPGTTPGSPIDVRELSDWVLDIENKSITNRPDLWGHHGIAREVAAILDRPLRPYEDFIAAPSELEAGGLPEIPIVIDDPVMCPRYSGLMMTGLRVQPAPLWMQARLSHVGQRPIDLLVDLTNYIMFDVGQPTHAFDGKKVDRIEVAVSRSGQTFTTLDGMSRTLPEGTIMIQSNRRNVALAGIMGGLDTEVTAGTTTMLLEAANFDPATIRRTASAMGHRTEASARFEKALDPANTVLAIGRFVRLARQELPDVKVVSRLSDCYPRPKPPVKVSIDLAFANRFIGIDVSRDRVERILDSLGFRCRSAGKGKLGVDVPSYRATRDVSIEADLIEEIARFIGYNNVPASLPDVTMRSLPPVASLQVERRSLHLLCEGLGFNEVQNYVWYDLEWLDRLGFDPPECVEIRGASAGGRRLRHTLVPDLLAAADLNRRTLQRFNLVTIGSVFFAEPQDDWPMSEGRRLGMAMVGRGNEDALLNEQKVVIETWTREILGRPVAFAEADRTRPLKPWEHPLKIADVHVGGRNIGRVTVVPLACRLRIDEHLRRWTILLTEIDLDVAVAIGRAEEALEPVPTHPQVELDFSVLLDAARRYAAATEQVGRFAHPLLRRITFLDSYEGTNIPAGRRSLTFRTYLGAADRTLTDQDLQDFRQAFTAHLEQNGLTLRK